MVVPQSKLVGMCRIQVGMSALPPSVTCSVKGGSTVPLKWKLQGEGGIEIQDVAAVDVKNLRAVPVACSSTIATDVAFTTTGGTSLRYDATAWQFILNWQTPKQPGTCWRVDVPFVDGSVRSAQFKLK